MPARKTATAYADLVTLIRREISDPATDAAGLAITNTRFSAADIDAASTHAQMYLGRELRLVSQSEGRVYTDGNYTAGAHSIAIPGAAYFDPIVKVENIEDSSRPILIPSIPFDEIERYALSTNSLVYIPRGFPYRCCLVDNGTERHIMLRPRPQATIPIRVWRLDPMMIFGNEANALAAQYQDLVVLVAAQELLSRREGMSEDQNARLLMALRQFRAAANRTRQPQRIRKSRVGWS